MRERVVNGGVVACLACCVVAAPLRASPLDAGSSDRVALDVPKDAAILVTGAIASVVPLALSSQLAPSSCRWCDCAAGTAVNPVDDWFHQHLTGSIFSRNTSTTLSSALALGAMPAIALGGTWFATGPHATEGAGLRNGVIVMESTLTAVGLTHLLKYTTARQRPYAHYQNFATGPGSDLPTPSSDDSLSFPSGHASFAAALGTSAAMLATLEDSSAAPWLWASTVVVTTATATLRMTSEVHYFTDVVAGTAIGAGCGVLFPLLHRRGLALAGRTIPTVSVREGSAAVSLAGVF